MFVKKKKTVLYTSPTILLSIFFTDLFIISTDRCIYIYIFFNTNTGLRIKKTNKKYTLTYINDQKRSIKNYTFASKKINKKYTLTCISIKESIH